VVKKEGVELKQYPERFFPGKEEFGDNEIRLTCIGSGNPIVRRAQAATGWLCELGNGDKFVFDVGGGTVQNLWSLEYSPAELDKLFLTHLHLDHVGDFHVLFDGMGWARNSPLEVWGPSGYTTEMGTAVFCDLMHKAAL
jgi:ribonuclease Z